MSKASVKIEEIVSIGLVITVVLMLMNKQFMLLDTSGGRTFADNMLSIVDHTGQLQEATVLIKGQCGIINQPDGCRLSLDDFGIVP